jgi:hypothetical protein
MEPGLYRKVQQALELDSRMERISVDSYWAHRSSGLRVALMRAIDRLEARNWEMSDIDDAFLDALIEQGYWILENAAKELRGSTT